MKRTSIPIVTCLLAIAPSAEAVKPDDRRPVPQHAKGSPTAQAYAAPRDVYQAWPNRLDEDCYKAPQHDVAELCATWRAAIAAEESARLSFWGDLISLIGALLSFFGLVFVVLALRQAQKANKIAASDLALARIEARRVASASEGSLEIARAQLQSERLIAQAQSRPYIFPNKTQLYPHVAPYENALVAVDIKNFGSTIATDIKITGDAVIAKCPLKKSDLEKSSMFERPFSDMPPGKIHQAVFKISPILQTMHGKLGPDGYGIYIIVQIRYRDLFGNDHANEHIGVSFGGLDGAFQDYHPV